MLEDARHGRKTGWFTLQWHLTHACDLHCKHCYDRTLVSALRLPDCERILDELEAFAVARGVKPNVILSGGNPFLYKWFFELVESVARRGLPYTILGNPVSRGELERLVAIKRPKYFQVSLEGLAAHNDEIRGAGFYARVLEFLPLLREHGIASTVMLTLTKRNMAEIVPLARLLEGKADRMTFNRLSQVGEGAGLESPDREAYGRFMVEYLEAHRRSRMLGLKDNLFNIFRHELGMELTGGCTGQGCGAAFNFVAVLPNGDVHACRKFPSKIGNLLAADLGAIFDSDDAERYRRGPEPCDGCPIRKKCGGCPAVVHGQGLDPLHDRDPYCFMYD